MEEFLSSVRDAAERLVDDTRNADDKERALWVEEEFQKTKISISPMMGGDLVFELSNSELTDAVVRVPWEDIYCWLLGQFRPGFMGDEEKWRESIRKRGEAFIAVGKKYIEAAEKP